MIEPTESENLEEIDKFCDSLISIRMEIESLNYHDEKSVLKNSPHTLDEVCSEIGVIVTVDKKQLFH